MGLAEDVAAMTMGNGRNLIFDTFLNFYYFIFHTDFLDFDFIFVEI